MKISSINNISFNSTYKVTNDNNSREALKNFAVFCSKIQDCKGVYLEYSSNYYPLIKRENIEELAVVPDNLDGYLENFCASKGIVYKKS